MSNDALQRSESSQFARLPGVVFFGRRCELSRAPLARLLAGGVTVSAICIPTPVTFGPPLRRISHRPTIPLNSARRANVNRSIDAMSVEHGIPLYGLCRPLGNELQDLLRNLEPDLIVVSCFPWRLPASIVSQTPLGAINLHPSLLPRFRGPDPLFWAFQTGASDWGVTVHHVTALLDGGPILGQTPFQIPDGISGDDLEALAARLGGDLIANVVHDMCACDAEGIEQNESESSYFSFPCQADLVIRRDWSTKRALNFAVGIVALGYSALVETSRGTYEVRAARSRQQDTSGAIEVWLSDDTVVITTSDGKIEFELGASVKLD